MMPFHGADDLMQEDRRIGVGGWLLAAAAAASVAAVLVASFATNAHAQNQPQNCSGTVGATAAAVTFGHPPGSYVFICNPSATASLWLSTTGTAAANASGSFSLGPTVATATSACVTLTPMPTISIIASAGSTPYTCFYR
jgi:hypothetical protein